MPITTWALTDFCTTTDVAQEIRDLDIPLLGTDEVSKDDAVRAKIALAKDELFEMLDARVHDIFATANGSYTLGSSSYASITPWLAAMGKTYADLDGWEDHIHDPTVLKRVSVALTVRAILADGMLRHRANYDENATLIDAVWGVWDKKVHERFEVAVKRLAIDFDEDTTVSDDERVDTSDGTVWRL